MITDEIREELFRLQDSKYREFQVKLIPTVTPDSVIGVRTPALRKYAKELAKREHGFMFKIDPMVENDNADFLAMMKKYGF